MPRGSTEARASSVSGRFEVRARHLTFERALWRSGMNVLAGIDEAGRGALAGPLVAAAVCCENQQQIERMVRRRGSHLVRDSKTLTAAQREVARAFVCDAISSWCIGVVTSEEIDCHGIVAANRIAMERAIDGLACPPEFLLIDALTIDSEIPQWGIIDGDALSFLISAASILAKVTRDGIMETLVSEHAGFRFDQHRGYGTPEHLNELRTNGPCAMHRRSFEPVRQLLGGNQS